MLRTSEETKARRALPVTILCLITAVFWLAARPVAAHADAARWGVFGAREIESSDIAKFPKWTDMLNRNFKEEQRGDAPCTSQSLRAMCIVASWKSFIDREQGRSPQAELVDVNNEINDYLYRLDPYYWETPREFVVQDGDCKDYAIAKYFTLRKLGWSADDLRVVVLRDMDIQADHAILVAYLDGKTYSLDILVRSVLPTSVIHHYRPYYAINEDHWWIMIP